MPFSVRRQVPEANSSEKLCFEKGSGLENWLRGYSTGSSCRGSPSIPSTHVVAHNCLFQGIGRSLLAFTGTACTWYRHRYIQHSKHDTCITYTVLLRVIIAVMKLHNQSNLGRKGFIWFMLPHHCSSLEEVRTGT